MSRKSEAREVPEGNILLHAEGHAFVDGRFDLRVLERLLTNYRQIIDRTLPSVLGQRTLGDRLKRDLKYEVQISSGSLEVLLQLLWENKEPLMFPLVSDGGHAVITGVAKLIEDVLNFRRQVAKVLENGLRPRIVIDQRTTIDASINVAGDNNVVSVSGPQVVLAAKETKAPIDRLVQDVDGAAVKEIDIDSTGVSTHIVPEDRRIAGSEKEQLPEQMHTIGRLDTVAFSTRRGTLVTNSGRYPVTWDEAIRSQIHDIADVEGAAFIVRPTIDRRLFDNEPVGLHILRCFRPQGDLEL